MDECWNRIQLELSDEQRKEGLRRLHLYYNRYIKAPIGMSRPLGIESWISSKIQLSSIEFELRGKYDRLDYFEGGLALIDYKSGQPPNYTEEIDLQLGFYDLILEETYHQSLKQWKLIYLKTGEEVIYEVTSDHRRKVRALISALSKSLKSDRSWEPCPGNHCERCSYQQYCIEASAEPEPLPIDSRKLEPIQYVLEV